MEGQKHSGLGIASFVTSLASGIMIFLLIIIAAVMKTSAPESMDGKSAGATIVGLLLFAFIGTSLVALGLGIGGLLKKDRKKIFAILGTVFSAVAIVGTISLIMFGLAMRR